MSVLKLRVVSKTGEDLGTVDTLCVWKGEVIYTKYDKWGCSDSKPKISKFPKEVDIQCSLDGDKWQSISVPSVDDSELRHMAGVR